MMDRVMIWDENDEHEVEVGDEKDDDEFLIEFLLF